MWQRVHVALSSVPWCFWHSQDDIYSFAVSNRVLNLGTTPDESGGVSLLHCDRHSPAVFSPHASLSTNLHCPHGGTAESRLEKDSLTIFQFIMLCKLAEFSNILLQKWIGLCTLSTAMRIGLDSSPAEGRFSCWLPKFNRSRLLYSTLLPDTKVTPDF